MNELKDIILKGPFSFDWAQILLFILFTLHMLFVLLMIGTAVLAINYFILAWIKGRLKDLRYDKLILKTFLAHKSLAVVLGVGVLLVFHVYQTVPFLTGINFFAPFWMLIIVLLIISFFILDVLGHKDKVNPYVHLIFGLIGLVALLIVPGIFVAVVVAAENVNEWQKIVESGYQLTGALAFHWLFRYLHVLTAGVIFGSAFHYFFLKEADKKMRDSLLKWLIGSILFQFVIGICLYISLPNGADVQSNIAMIAGIISAVLLLWIIFYKVYKAEELRVKTISILLALILLPMLLTRQFLQNKTLIPAKEKMQANAEKYESKLDLYKLSALSTYKTNLKNVLNNGEALYRTSCAFCHGENGGGNGIEAGNLSIPPQKLNSVRASREFVYNAIINGVDGTAMPYFEFIPKGEINELIDYMQRNFNILDDPGIIPVSLSIETISKADSIYNVVCSTCHDAKGNPTNLSKGFNPAPPSFKEFSLTPQRTFKIITNGYPGTMMIGFESLPETIRWGLTDIVLKMRDKNFALNVKADSLLSK